VLSIFATHNINSVSLPVAILKPFWALGKGMDESADAVAQSDWERPAGRPHTSQLATMKNDQSYHNLSVEDATELALDRPLGRLLAASGAMH